MPFSNDSIVVEGLREFSKEIRAVDDKKLLGQAHKKVSQFVGDEAQRNVAQLVGRFPSLAKLQISPSAATTQVIVTLKKPFAHAGEWGTKTHVVYGKRVLADEMRRRVWPAWDTDGHLVHPVLRDKQQQIIDLYVEAIEEVTREVFPD